MTINKTQDKEVKGLFRCQGKRGDTWIYTRFKEGRLVRASLGAVSDHTLQEAWRWASNLNLEAAGKTPEYTLADLIDKTVVKAQQKQNRCPEYARTVATRYAPDSLPKKIDDITKAMINARHDKIHKDNGPTAAPRFVKIMK